ncbi:PEP-CTERM sorting domain-containing protein [Aliiglaciecola sp. 3_MG-2023]|uniref:PEP-CTERM sorting domain-containing protein n=1 Tax=Aliiglaciecola sp. 3_MG-2023 TaxID=3062644 RepID=UPI0026E306FA|nr:PEP-CTERM sorting domain-containing protein [Aliiglaciecola sp. 3_MG-2023]MDO6695655.1 PEP-CTERM sorting domain-containing protein [Aliiglaciecola sp. 3_MG-2023]
MLKYIKNVLFAGLILSSTAANAVLIDFNTVIPDEVILVNFNSTGLDWVYAGPVAPEEFGPGSIYAPSYRASEGWRFATQVDWSIRPDWTDFVIGSAAVTPVASYSDHSTYRFASEYWSNFSHVDLNDAAAGRITNGLDIGSLDGVWETFYVRDTAQVTVPEPSTIALMALSLFGLIITRRRR